MIIRQAVLDDIPKFSGLIEAFGKESLNEYGFKIEIETWNKTAEKVINSSFVVDINGDIVGIIALVVYQSPLGGECIAQEIIWYIKKEQRRYGVKLLRFVENWCLEQGIKKIIMIQMANLMMKKLGKFYQACGYHPLENHYIKMLGG